MFALAVALTVLLVLESLPSAVVQLARARPGLTRFDELTRLGVLQGRHLWFLTLLGSLHLFGTVAVIVGLWAPPLGVAGASVEALVFAWVLAMQLRSGDRGRALGAYMLFLTMALSVLVVDILR
ncbi:DoxX family protein [Streptomyces sp. NPDC059373]